MSIVRALWGPAAVYTLTSGIAAATPFFLLPVLTHVLTPAEYGLVAMFSVAVTVFGAFAGLSVHNSVGIRYFDRQKLDFPRYVGTCLHILAASTIGLLVLVGVFGKQLESLTTLPPLWLICAVLAAAAQTIISTLLAIWQSSSLPWRYGSFRVGHGLLDGLLSLLLVLAIGLGAAGRVSGIVVATLTMAVLALVILIRGKWATGPFDRGYARTALQFGVPLIPHLIGGVLIAVVDRIIISSVLDVASTGIYMVAVQLGAVLGLTTDAFNRAFAPWLFRQLVERNAHRDMQIVRLTYGYFVFVTAVALIIGVLAPVVLVVLVGEQFRGAAPLVSYIAIGFAFGGMYYMVTNYVFFAGRTAWLASLTISCGLFNVLASWWLVQRNGAVGAAQAYMLAQALLFVCTWVLAQKSYPMPWFRSLRKRGVRYG